MERRVGRAGKALEREPDSQRKPTIAGCNFVEVNCAHCAQQFQRHSLDTHENTECRLRPYSCDHCGEFATTFEDVVTNHHPVCERYPLPCPNKCDEIPAGFKYAIERRDLERHVKEECLLTVVECDFHYAGCKTRHPRKDMASHLTKSLVTHMSLMAAHGKQTATEVQIAATKAQRALEERDTQIAQLQREQTVLARENKSLKDQLELHSHLCTPPVTFTMTDFAQHKRNKDTWYSPPFYTHPHGYKMCLKVRCEEDSFFVGAPLMHGKFDDHLQWPFQKHVYIRPLNQFTDKNHICIVANFSFCPSYLNIGMRLTEGERQLKGRGEERPYTALDSQGDCTKAYIKDNTIHLQVSEVIDSVLVSRLER